MFDDLFGSLGNGCIGLSIGVLFLLVGFQVIGPKLGRDDEVIGKRGWLLVLGGIGLIGFNLVKIYNAVFLVR